MKLQVSKANNPIDALEKKLRFAIMKIFDLLIPMYIDKFFDKSSSTIKEIQWSILKSCVKKAKKALTSKTIVKR